MIRGYVKKLKAKVAECSFIITSEQIEIEFAEDGESGVVQGRLKFIDGSCVEFTEWVSEERFRYRFHYMDQDDSLIRRWDSAPHHKEVATFPFHLHTSDEVCESEPLRLVDVLDKIGLMIAEK